MVSQGQDITLKDWLCHSWHSSFSTQSLLLQQELSHSFFVLWQISDNTSGHFDSEHVTSPKGPIFSQVKIWQTPTFAISPVWHTIVLTHSPWYMNTELHARFSHSLWVSICISRRLCCCHLFYFWFKFSSLDFNIFEDLFLLLLRDFKLTSFQYCQTVFFTSILWIQVPSLSSFLKGWKYGHKRGKQWLQIFISQWNKQKKRRKKKKKTPKNPTPLLNLLGKGTETVLSWICLRHSIICSYSLMFFHVSQLKQEN